MLLSALGQLRHRTTALGDSAVCLLLAVRGLCGREASGSCPVDRPDALVSFEELQDIMGMHEIEELEQRFLTPEQLEAKYRHERKASIMPDAKPAKPNKPAAKSKQEA